MFKVFWLATLWLIESAAGHALPTVTAYNTFLEDPQHPGQDPGFGYGGGLHMTTTMFGLSFTPTISGNLSDVWIAIGTDSSDVGTDIFDLLITTSGPDMAPDFFLAGARVYDELSKGESIVELGVDQRDIFLHEGTMYWLLLVPGPGTPNAGWLSGPEESPSGAYSAYPDPGSETGWAISKLNANGALRIDVVPISASTSWMLMVVMFAALVGLRGSTESAPRLRSARR